MSGAATGDVAAVLLDPRGFLRIVHPEGAKIDIAEILRIRTIHAHWAGQRKIPVLVDARGLRSMSLVARREAAGPEVARITSRTAIVVGGPVSKMIGSFFLRVARPLQPTRLFTDVAAAEVWLLEGATPPGASA